MFISSIIGLFIGHLVVFYGLGQGLHLVDIEAMREKNPLSKGDIVELSLVGVLMILINPILEEWFWRIFLYECFPK